MLSENPFFDAAKKAVYAEHPNMDAETEAKLDAFLLMAKRFVEAFENHDVVKMASIIQTLPPPAYAAVYGYLGQLQCISHKLMVVLKAPEIELFRPGRVAVRKRPASKRRASKKVATKRQS